MQITSLKGYLTSTDKKHIVALLNREKRKPK